MSEQKNSFQPSVFPELDWTLNISKPLARVFNRFRFGNLEEHFVMAAGRGDVKALKEWKRKGANIHKAGNDAFEAANINKQDKVLETLLEMGIVKPK